jgi:hypothetical protein
MPLDAVVGRRDRLRREPLRASATPSALPATADRRVH